MPRNRSELDKAREQGTYEAAKEIRRLRVDQSRPVDIFGIIESAGIWLFFSPLTDVQGAFLSNASTGQKAILINSRRPLSMQRLTAAHEYGHYILGHSASLDDLADVETPQTSRLLEAAAQVFANDFLMPPQLVERAWRDLGLPARSGEVMPQQVYLLALNLGVSYTALVFQLRALKKVTRQDAAKLAKYQPRRIKQGLLGRDIGPVDSWADVWPLDEHDDRRELSVRVNDQLSIALPESPSTGFQWSVTAPETVDMPSEAGLSPRQRLALLDGLRLSAAKLALAGDEFDGSGWAESGAPSGSGGRRYLGFVVLQPGEYSLQLDLSRPWLPTSAKSYRIGIKANQKATGDEDNGVRESLKQPLARNAASQDEE